MSAHPYQIAWRAYHRQWLQSGQPLLGFFKQSIHPGYPAVEFDAVVAAFKKLRGLIWSVELSTRPRREPPRPNSLPSMVPSRVSADALTAAASSRSSCLRNFPRSAHCALRLRLERSGFPPTKPRPNSRAGTSRPRTAGYLSSSSLPTRSGVMRPASCRPSLSSSTTPGSKQPTTRSSSSFGRSTASVR